MPTKWLQERAKGSKNGHGMPPHRAFCGLQEAHPGEEPFFLFFFFVTLKPRVELYQNL